MAMNIGGIFNRPTGSDKSTVGTSVYVFARYQLPNMINAVDVEDVAEDPNIAGFIEGCKMYITEHTYLYLYTALESIYTVCHLTAGNEAAGACLVSGQSFSMWNISSQYSAYFEVTTSAKGDVLISGYRGSADVFQQKLEQMRSTVIVCKCKNVVTGGETRGILLTYNAQCRVPVYLVTDDTEGFNVGSYNNVVNANSINASYTLNIMYTGINTFAKYTAIMPICCISSAYVTVNTYRLVFSPRHTYGNAELNGKTYYFVDNIAMLDEEQAVT